MRHTHSKKLLAGLALALAFIANACGRSDDFEQDESDSSLQSLSGFPCQEYGQNVASDSFVCTNVNIGHKRLNVLYRLDGFNAPQKAKLREALNIASRNYSAYWTNPTNSPLLACVVRNAREALDPQNSKLSISFNDVSRKVIWAITTLSFGFQYHVDTLQPIVISAFDEGLDSKGSTAMARAFIGSDALPVTTDMNFKANRIALNQPLSAAFDYSANAFAGAMIHEMLHRKGYVHASSGRSIGPLVYEFGNCISDLNNGTASLTGGKKPLPRVD